VLVVISRNDSLELRRDPERLQQTPLAAHRLPALPGHVGALQGGAHEAGEVTRDGASQGKLDIGRPGGKVRVDPGTQGVRGTVAGLRGESVEGIKRTGEKGRITKDQRSMSRQSAQARATTAPETRLALPSFSPSRG